jgi:uncharacterized protein YcbK (DUF882 family)
LCQKGYRDNLLVVCTKRSGWINFILVKVSQAAPGSRHLKGEALDFLVLDINSDGKINSENVDIVHKIQDREIIVDKGGIGTYKHENVFTAQLVHIDCRGYRARWNK